MSEACNRVLWLFDLGNTNLKGRWTQAGRTGVTIGIDWTGSNFARRLRAGLARWPAPGRVLVASVAAAERADRLRAALAQRPGVRAEWLSSPHRGGGITTHYRVPARLGIDRFLAMVGARAASGGAAFVSVGCGTALTLDAVDATGNQREGLIVPSPDLMVWALRRGTAIAETNPDAFGEAAAADDTARAIRAGCRRAAVALVRAFHAQYRQSVGAERLWLHGGGAPGLQEALRAGDGSPAQLLDDAVWRGLEAWAAAQPAAAPGP